MSAFVTMTAEKIESERKRSRPVEKPKKVAVIKRNKARVGIILVIIAMVIIAALAVIHIHPAKNRVAVIDTTMGIIRVELYEDKMPITTANFIKLANDGFYNGLISHRIKDDFMIQGGGYYSNGTKKTDPYGPISFETNPDVTHVDGAISMARTGELNSATNEFFICDGEQQGLDDAFLQENYGQRGYAAFGVVIEGIDIVRDIASRPHDNSVMDANGDPDGSGKPLTDIIINSITIVNQ